MFRNTQKHNNGGNNMLGISSKINELFEAEVNNRVKDINEGYQKALKRNTDLSKELYDTKEMVKNLKYVENQLGLIEQLRSTISKDNVLSFLQILNLEKSGYEISMRRDDIPTWFIALYEYYPEKEKVLAILDLFNIDYPDYAKKFKMPYDYNEEEVLYLIDNLNDISNPNGNYYSNNESYFYDFVRSSNGNVTGRCYSLYIPWQLFLKNPLLVKDNVFKKIIKKMNVGSGKYIRFFKLQDYQDLPIEKAEQLVRYLPKEKFYDEHKVFISKNSEVIKNNPTLARCLVNNITSSSYSPFHFLNFPLEYQMEWIRQARDLATKIGYVEKMQISKEEKIEFVTELASESLSDKGEI